MAIIIILGIIFLGLVTVGTVVFLFVGGSRLSTTVRRLLVILGIILGLSTAGAVVVLFIVGSGAAEPAVESGPPLEPTSIPVANVLVALQPIERGAEFVQGSIGPRPWPANNVPPDTIADEVELFNKLANTHIGPGQPILRTMLIDKGELNIWPAPAVADGIAYFGRNEGILYALDAQTGRELWRFRTSQQILSTPTVAQGMVYFSDSRGTLYALDAKTGKELWRSIISSFPGNTFEPAAPIVIEGTIYFENRGRELFHAIDAVTGEEIWAVRYSGTVSIADGRVYFTRMEVGYIEALDLKTGQPIDLKTGQNK